MDEQKGERIRQLEREIGQMALDMDILEEAAKPSAASARSDRVAGRPVVRSDNGLIFQSTRLHAACPDCRLRQEFIIP